MRKRIASTDSIKKHVAAAMTVAGFAAATGAHAQSSVTFYGAIDNGLSYQNNGTTVGSSAQGHSAVKMSTGVWLGDRFGLKGSEDLGGGSQAIFQLESGFSAANGTAQYAGGIFTRQAWVGMTNSAYGTLTAGRQYTAYYTLLSPYSPTTWLTGYYGAHPGDVDSLDTSYRVNNSLVYLSPSFGGVTLVPDLDHIEALAEDRAALWARIGNATFLTDAEKRQMLGIEDGK